MKTRPRYKWVYFFADLIAINLAYFIALKIYTNSGIDVLNSDVYIIHPFFWFYIPFSVFCTVFIRGLGLFKEKIVVTFFPQFVRIFQFTTIYGLLFISSSFLIKFNLLVTDSRLTFVLTGGILFILMVFIRLFLIRYVIHLNVKKSSIFEERVLIIGINDESKKISKQMEENDDFQYSVVGFCDDDFTIGQSVYGIKLNLGHTKHLKQIIKTYKIKEVVLCQPEKSDDELFELIKEIQNMKVRLNLISKQYLILNKNVGTSYIADVEFISMNFDFPILLNEKVKRFFDIVITLISMLLLSPVFILVAFLVKVTSKGPIFYNQKRIGKDGKEFFMYKFRSMKFNTDTDKHKKFVQDMIKSGKQENKENKVYKLDTDTRITKVGKFIRKFSIDEFPQLINVLKGEMSLVGPRPCLLYELELYNPFHKRRLSVTPGCTGLWQVSGHNETTFEEMIALDLFYVHNRSILLDFYILFRTIPVLLFPKYHK